ncbi:hypothetical protein [Desulfovibrio gilichinskyi]|uniref:Uncharacterized protein n=1 Tax=Desulfovibrio gilichinskyi TaxID=1519643 RepID=A0A1X7ER83_9BACT|nr:hypothetical protein [Desulfovibrio gilichinskyi]SMF38682.1 hypothetical protein SAMN06295933_3255 [Desulfovibrio gilichinskyi]
MFTDIVSMTPEYGAQQPTVIASSTLAAPIGGEEIGAAGSVVAGRAAPYLEKAVRNSRNVINRANDVVKNIGRKVDIKIKNSPTGIKYGLDANEVVDGATGLVDGLPPSVGTGGKVAAVKWLAETLIENIDKKN